LHWLQPRAPKPTMQIRPRKSGGLRRATLRHRMRRIARRL